MGKTRREERKVVVPPVLARWGRGGVFRGGVLLYLIAGEVIKTCRLSWLTNGALVYMSPNAGGGIAGSQPMSTVHMEPK
jgi:hypothetical protein